MSLTGWGLPVLLTVVAVLTVVPLVLGLPRRKGGRAALLRAGQLLAFTLAVLMLAGLGVNATQKLFASWSDLKQFVFGGAQVSQSKSYGGPASSSPSESSPSASASHSGSASSSPTSTPIPELPPLPSAERDQTFTVTGAKSGLTGTIQVLLPEGYDPKRATGYPILMAIHGYPGLQKTWLTSGTMNLPTTVAKTVAEGQVAAPIVILPQVTFDGVDSECVDLPGGQQVQTWVNHDVVAWVKSHLRAGPDKEAWAISGFSAGGFCAAYLGMKNPAQFGAAQIFGGYFRPIFAKGFNPFTAEQMAGPEYDLAAMARTVKPPIAIWTQTARGDSLSYPSTANFLKAVQAPMSATELITEGGGHAYFQWRPHVQESLAWLGKTLPGFAPGR